MTPLYTLFSEPFLHALGWALVHSLWQGAALAAGAALLLRLVRQQSAAVRYGVTLGALVGQVLAFVVTIGIGYDPAPAVMRIGLGHVPTGGASLWPTALEVSPSLTRNVLGETWQAVQEQLPWIVVLWLLGAGLFMLRLAGGWLLVQRLTHQGVRPAPVAWQNYLNQLASQLRIPAAVRLLESTEISVPMTIGWLKPVVLLPVGLLAGLSPQQVEAVLAHELAHIRRYDYLVNLIQSVVEVLFFFHPASWWLSARMREERENCCDDLAVRLRGERISLAQALVHIEERRQSRLDTPALAMAFGARRPSLLERVKRVLGVAEERSTPPWNGLLIVGGLLLVGSLVVGQHRTGSITRMDQNRQAVVRPEIDTDTVVFDEVDWPADTARAIEEEIAVEVDEDTLLIDEAKHEQEMEQHERAMEQLEKQLEKESQAMEANERLMEKYHREMARLDELQLQLARETDQKVLLDRQRLLYDRFVKGEVEQKDFEKAKQALLRAQQNMTRDFDLNQLRMDESIRRLHEKQARLLNDTAIARSRAQLKAFGTQQEQMAQILQKMSKLSAIHETEMMKLQAQLQALDTLRIPEPPAPAPAVAPAPLISPAPAVAPAPPSPAHPFPKYPKASGQKRSRKYGRQQALPTLPESPASAAPALPLKKD